MENLGFQWFKDSISGAEGLYVKKINKTLYLTVGMTIHRYYDDAFTADLYLSKNTTIYCTWNDIPNDCIKRPNELLQESDGVINYKKSWWSSEDSINDFLLAIHLSEQRMCKDEELIKRINNSKEVANLCNISSLIKMNIDNLPDMSFSFIPPKEIDNIPFDWFKSTELTLHNLGMDITPKNVKFYASDAYRQYILSLKEKQ